MLHSVCDKTCYGRAVAEIKQRVNNPVFIIFSDDIKWEKENIITDCEIYWEDGTNQVWEKLRMIGLCKHFILVNSTFSWCKQ